MSGINTALPHGCHTELGEVPPFFAPFPAIVLVTVRLHEAPNEILNYYDERDRRILTEGMVLAIEPFLTPGIGRVTQERDGWSLRTVDKTIAAQFEHTIIVTKNEPIILTL